MFALYLDSDFGAVYGIDGPFVNKLSGGKCPFSRFHLPQGNAYQCFTDEAGEWDYQYSCVAAKRKKGTTNTCKCLIRQWPCLLVNGAHIVAGICLVTSLLEYNLFIHSLLVVIDIYVLIVLMYWYYVIDTCHHCDWHIQFSLLTGSTSMRVSVHVWKSIEGRYWTIGVQGHKVCTSSILFVTAKLISKWVSLVCIYSGHA